MPRSMNPEIVGPGLERHPALRAWSRLPHAQVEPGSILVLRERSNSALYRLNGVGRSGSPVIAKRAPTHRASLERLVYEEVLLHAALTSPHYYGFVPGDPGSAWLFLEDVGRQRYGESNHEHTALAARWLARMHASATLLAPRARLAERLPDGGPTRYLEHLHSGRLRILEALARSEFEAEDVETFRGIVVLHGHLERRWSRVEEACIGLPATLVHGDFRPKNAHVRATPAGTAIFPMDWETAGWGVPAIDLTRVDTAAYTSEARVLGSGVAAETVECLAKLGQLFRFLAAIDWESVRLDLDAPELLVRPRMGLRILGEELSRAARALGLS